MLNRLRRISVVGFTLVLTLSGCEISKSSQANEGVNIQEQYDTTSVKIRQLQQKHPSDVTPTLVFIAIDQSSSMGTARVAQIKPEDLQAVYEALIKTGGTFAISSICQNSNLPLVRATLDSPPTLSSITLKKPPEVPNTTAGNPFTARKKSDAYQKVGKEYQTQLATIDKELTAYQQSLTKQKTNNRQKLDAIKAQVKGIIQHPRNCQATDIQNSIGRANLFFEEQTSWPKTRKFALFITDGLDTFSKQPAQIQADKVLLVNGSNDVGIFNKIPHQQFEAPSAALKQLGEAIEKH
jgi:hypothetical protein